MPIQCNAKYNLHADAHSTSLLVRSTDTVGPAVTNAGDGNAVPFAWSIVTTIFLKFTGYRKESKRKACTCTSDKRDGNHFYCGISKMCLPLSSAHFTPATFRRALHRCCFQFTWGHWRMFCSVPLHFSSDNKKISLPAPYFRPTLCSIFKAFLQVTKVFI